MRDRKLSSFAVKSPVDACHHVAIVVRDAASAREFYGELLGLEELERPADVADRFAGAWYRIGSIELHVFEQPDYQPSRAAIGPHLALHTSDFDDAISRLTARGCAFAFGPGRGPDGVARAILRDPTGNVVELTDAALRS
jgi:catechol 2,3-dioxygenase-like lactoylglutathione lyase family enzyme